MKKTNSSIKSTNGKSEKEFPRLQPVENPGSIKMKLAYWLTKLKMGKVITPLKIVQARMPETLSLTHKLTKIQNKLSLPTELIFYIKSYVAILNGCSFCIDIAKAEAADYINRQKYKNLQNYESADAFDEPEQAALEYVEMATKNNVTDEVFAELQLHYREKEVVEITWLAAVENYFNLINRSLNIGSDNLCDFE